MSALLDQSALGADGLAALQALAALLLMLALAWYARRVLPRAGPRTSTAMQVEARLALDLRNALVIVRVEQRRLLLATSEQGPARLLAELSEAEPASAEARASTAAPGAQA